MIKLAVLIDAENVSHYRIGVVLNEIRKLGFIMILRAYGDFTNKQSSSWKKWEHVINLIQVDNPNNCKNRSDKVLLIDAMDLLYDETIDEFCIVSSDSDFTPLIERIREFKEVHVFGDINTVEIYRSTATTFTYIGSLYTESNIDEYYLNELKELLKQVVNNIYKPLARIGYDIHQIYPQFDPKEYRCKNLTELFNLFDDTFEIFVINNIQNVRCKRILNIDSPAFVPSNFNKN